MNIGGKPLNSWPAFIVPTFEMTILFAAFAAGARHAGAERTAAAVSPGLQRRPFLARLDATRYFLLITAKDEKFDRRETWEFLHGLKPMEVNEVED